MLKKIHLRVTLHKLVISGGGEEARPCWCTVRPRVVFLWSHRPEKKRSDLELHSLPSSSRVLWVMGLRESDSEFLFCWAQTGWGGLSIALGLGYNGWKDQFIFCSDLICVLPKFLCRSPTPSTSEYDCIWAQGFKDVLQLRWGHASRP